MLHMSQNIHLTGSAFGTVRVRAGWDAPLNELYCNVELLERDAHGADLPACFSAFVYEDVPSMLAALACADIRLPEGMQRAIEADLRSRAGNVIREFS